MMTPQNNPLNWKYFFLLIFQEGIVLQYRVNSLEFEQWPGSCLNTP